MKARNGEPPTRMTYFLFFSYFEILFVTQSMKKVRHTGYRPIIAPSYQFKFVVLKNAELNTKVKITKQWVAFKIE